MRYLSILLLAVISFSCSKEPETTYRLDGNWTPLLVINDNEKFCEPKSVMKPFSIEIVNNGESTFKDCNNYKFQYAVFENEIKISRAEGLYTDEWCISFLGELINIWKNEWNYQISNNSDTLNLFKYDKDLYVKLIRTEIFDSLSYIKFYYTNNCKWPFTEDEKSVDTFEGEPIFGHAEVRPQLCSGIDPQKIIEDNLFLTNYMVKMKIYDRVFLRVLIDKCGNIGGLDNRSKIDKTHEDAIYHVLDLMPCWHPATIDDNPVNMYYPLIFDFRKFK